jgi:dTDP-4-dehydrorhamnose reductase
MGTVSVLAVLGAGGQLGTDLVRQGLARGLDVVALTHDEADVADAQSVGRALGRVRPAVVVNSAGLTNVERCEDEVFAAYRVNAIGALFAARAARELGARYVHISTDYVFAGNKPPSVDGCLDPATAYTEDDAVEPLNVYGASKAASEHLVAQTLDDHLIVRVSSLFGVAGARGKGGNFVEAILKKAREGGPLKVVADQWMTPTSTADAGGAILNLALGGARGVVHVTNAGGCTWHALAVAAVSLTGLDVPVEPVPAATYPGKARRPRNSALHAARLASLLGAPLRPWRDALRAYLVAKGHLS